MVHSPMRPNKNDRNSFLQKKQRVKKTPHNIGPSGVIFAHIANCFPGKMTCGPFHWAVNHFVVLLVS